MDRLPPDPIKLLEAWMEWERGETPPGRVMSTLKTGGLRDVLEELAAVATTAAAAAASEASDAGQAAEEKEEPSAEAWTPVV